MRIDPAVYGKHESCTSPSGEHDFQTGPNGEKYCNTCGYLVW